MTATGNADLIYARQSLDSTRSTDEQETAGRARADADDRAVFGVYRDGVSASRHSTKVRKDWARLLADLERPGVGRLWLWESSRGDRELESWAAMLTRCRKYGVRIHVETHGRTYDMSVARDWRTLAEDGVDSQYESEKIRDRVVRAMAANAAAGAPHGAAPYGYRRSYRLTPAGKRVMTGQNPYEPEAAVVRRIFAEVARGTSLRQLAADLNAEEVPTNTAAAKWMPHRVRDLALNPAYAGKRSHAPGSRTGGRATRNGNATVVNAQWPPLVDLETFHNVGTLLTDPARRTSRPGRTKHLLSLIATCGVCGGPMTVRYTPDNRHPDRRREGDYFCRDASHVRITQASLDEYVDGIVRDRLGRPEVAEEVVTDTDDTDVQRARDELAEATAHHGEMIRLLGSRKLSAVAFAAAEPQVLADMEAARTRLAELTAPTAFRMLGGGPGADLIDCWEGASVVARRDVVRNLFASIVVNRRPPGGGVPVEDRVEFVLRTA